MDPILEHFVKGFEQAEAGREGTERRIGAELKFPLVNPDGSSVDRETVDALWEYLQELGWTPDKDAVTGRTVGARKPGAQNDTVASCETGYSKTEFSLAHVADLFELQKGCQALREELRGFTDRRNAFFLAHGIHPVSRPNKGLMMKKVRASVWDNVFPGNTHVPPEDGMNIHLFTVNSASHVHVSTGMEESVKAVNVLAGYAGAQIALTAHSKVWKNQVDPEFKCVAEKFWDWWIAEKNRVGMPLKPFSDLEDYVNTIASFRPIFVKREGIPYLLEKYETFREYYESRPATGTTLEGREVELTPVDKDIDVHSTCYWFNARISRYYTVENRINDQQPPEDVLVIPAMTLGLMANLDEAVAAVASHDWQMLLESREQACRDALEGKAMDTPLKDLSAEMLDLARKGLEKRGLGEEKFLDPLSERLGSTRCPADEAAEIFSGGGAEALVKKRRL